MALANRDRRQPVQEPAHDLHRRLRSRIANTAGHDHRPVRRRRPKTDIAQGLSEAADEADRSGCAERRQVVLVHAVAQARIADLVQPGELVEPVRPAVRHQEPVERDGETRFPEGLDGLRLPRTRAPAGISTCVSAVGVERVRDQAVHG